MGPTHIACSIDEVFEMEAKETKNCVSDLHKPV